MYINPHILQVQLCDSCPSQQTNRLAQKICWTVNKHTYNHLAVWWKAWRRTCLPPNLYLSSKTVAFFFFFCRLKKKIWSEKRPEVYRSLGCGKYSLYYSINLIPYQSPNLDNNEQREVWVIFSDFTSFIQLVHFGDMNDMQIFFNWNHDFIVTLCNCEPVCPACPFAMKANLNRMLK